MKALIFSDSHGISSYMKQVLRSSPDVEYVFFLGDGASDIEEVQKDFCDKIFYCVRGNNDWMCPYNDSHTIELCGKRIFLTHGHNSNVKSTDQNLYYKACADNIDIVLFGHTHTPYEKYYPNDKDGVYLFNPGSIGKSDTLGRLWFGRLEIRDDGIILSHGSV